MPKQVTRVSEAELRDLYASVKTTIASRLAEFGRIGREAGGEFRYPPPAVVDFGSGVDARKKAIAKAFKGLGDALDLYYIYPYR